jgi:hypothetical protein
MIPAYAAETFPVVDGDKQAVIVGSDRRQARTLQNFIEKSTGRKLRFVQEKDYDSAADPYAIYIRQSEMGGRLFGVKLKEMDQDAYIVHVTPKAVVLIGAGSYSDGYAQYDFLREYLGIDSYFPSDCGLVIPKHETVRVKVETRIEEPVFLSRAFSGLNGYRSPGAGPGIPWRMYRRYQFHHNIHSFIPVKEFGKTHPEYFAERAGKRVIVSSSASNNPCTSNPGVVQAVIKKCREYFDKNPKRLTISLGMTDGGWCDCAECNALDGPDIWGEEGKGRRYFIFLNQVARELKKTPPDKYIGMLAYRSVMFPPAGITVERNIMPYMCYTRSQWSHPEVKERDLKNTNAWLSRVDRFGIYEYLYGSGFSIPRLYLHNLAKFLKHVGSKAPGSGFYAEIYANHGLDGPKAWVVEKLVWNPNQDVDKLVRRWCAGVFSEAAAPMERYFRGLEKTYMKGGRRIGPVFRIYDYYNSDAQLEMFRVKDLKPRWRDLEKARILAKSEAVKERIEYFASTFKISDLIVREYHAYKDAVRLFKKGVSSKELLAALIKGDREAPEEDVKAYIAELRKGDPSKFMSGVQIKVGTELARKIVLDLAWTEAYRKLKAGERDPEKVADAARATIAAAAPEGSKGDTAAERRLDALAKMASRVTVAHRVAKPPVIDGKPDEASWRWVDQYPWFAWKSGVQMKHNTHFALSYDDDYLYLALRCPQDDLAERRKCTGYDVPAWKYASIEFFINPDGRDGQLVELRGNFPKKDSTGIAPFQCIPAFGGGLWERAQRATEKYETTDTLNDEAADPEWRAELKLSWQRLGFSPMQFPYMRINFVRNVGEGGHTGVAWFPSTGAHGAYDARGWVVFK